MRCASPFRQGVAEHGCGQCIPCRVNRRRLWTSRIILESLCHDHSSFVTLTYDEESHPRDGCVRVSELQGFLKRLRAAISPRRIRYFGVGEYGDQTLRPHYHLALFGLPEDCDVSAAWRKGFVHVGTLTPESAAYLAGYTTKKMTSFGAPGLKGLAPEFARMSLRPGIGALAIPAISSEMVSRSGAAFVGKEGDVVRRFRARQRFWPLGRYLVRLLRESAGVPEESARLMYEKQLQEFQQQGWPGRLQRDQARVASEAKARYRNSVQQSRKSL